MINDWKEDFNKIVLSETQYSGTRNPEDKIISASSLGKEVQYLLMQKISGKNVEKKEIDASTLGSIHQLGLDAICEKHSDQYEYAVRLKHKLPNGWIVSGEFDILDKKNNVIIDGKLLGSSGYKNTIKNKDNPHGDYNLQVGVLSYLVHKERGIKCSGGLSVFNKGGTKAKENVYSLIDIAILDYDEIEELLLEKTNDIDSAEKNGLDETEHCDIYKFGKFNGKPARCELYCDYKDICNTFKSNANKRLHGFIGNIDINKELKNHKIQKNIDSLDDDNFVF